MSVALDMELQGLNRLHAAIQTMRGLGKDKDLFEVIGAVVESQTEQRIHSEKEDHEGNAWAEWSYDYAETRGSEHSLLVSEGFLKDSITFDASSDNVEVGSNRVYAAYQHEMRPFLGVSDANWNELQGTIEGFISEQLS